MSLEDCITGGVWKPASVEDEPRTILSRFQVYKVKNPKTNNWDIHFAGWCGEGRVCSAVQSFDKATRCGITRSGRVYQLSGDPGMNMDAMYVWGNWLAIYGNPEHECITEEYLRV